MKARAVCSSVGTSLAWIRIWVQPPEPGKKQGRDEKGRGEWGREGEEGQRDRDKEERDKEMERFLKW